MKTKKNYTKTFAVVSVTLLSLFFVHCTYDSLSVESNSTIQKESTGLKKIAKMEYLDVDISDPTKLNEEQKGILNQAKTRIDSYITYDKKLKNYKFKKILKGKDINISERLYEFFKTQVDKSNEMLNEIKKSKDFYLIQDIKDSKKLHVFKSKQNFKNKNYSVARLQSGDAEAAGLPPNSSGVDVHWWGVEVHLSESDLNKVALGGTIAGVLLGLAPTGITQYIAAGSFITAAGAAYYSSQYDNGIVLYLGWSGYYEIHPQ